MSPEEFAQPALADGEVRYVGEYVAAVVAESAAVAEDAVELVDVEYDALPSVNDPREAHEVTLAWDAPAAADAFAAAELTVRASLTIPRVAVAPMEGRAILAVPEPDGRLTVYASTQAPHWSRVQLARSLGLPPDFLRVVTPHVGGAFGGKAVGGVAPYVVACAAARRLGRPVRFVEPHGLNLATMQGRGLSLQIALHARRNGTIVGLEIEELCDAGAYPSTGSVEPGKTQLMACGPYRVPAVGFRARSVRTDRASTGAYRGPGRAEAAAALERALDLLARELELDPAEVRRRNLLTPTELPATSASGAHYDDGDLPALLAQLLDRAEYPRWREEQRTRRAASAVRVLGIGLATVLDSTAWFERQETACVRVLADGRVRVFAGTASAGQLHARAYAAIVAETLPVFVDEVEVVEGDTDIVEGSAGTSGSRSLQLAGGAIHGAAVDVLEQARQRAADLLEAAVDDVVVDGRAFVVRGAPARGITLAEVAARDPRSALDAALRVRPGGRHLHACCPPLGGGGRRGNRCGHRAPALRGHGLRPGFGPAVRHGPGRGPRPRRASRRPSSKSCSTTTAATRSAPASPTISYPPHPTSRRSRPGSTRPKRAATHSPLAASAKSAWSPRRRPSTVRCWTRSRTSVSGTSTCPAHPNASGVPCVPRDDR